MNFYIVHWPGQDTVACEDHRKKLERLAETLGFQVSCTPTEETICANCENVRRQSK